MTRTAAARIAHATIVAANNVVRRVCAAIDSGAYDAATEGLLATLVQNFESAEDDAERLAAADALVEYAAR